MPRRKKTDSADTEYTVSPAASSTEAVSAQEETGIKAENTPYSIEAAKKRVLDRENAKQRNNAKSSSFCITADKYAIFNKEIQRRKSSGFKTKVWESEEDLSQAISDYIDFVLEIKLYPTISALCLWLDITNETFQAIMRSGDKRSFKLEKFRMFLDDFSAQNIVSTEGNPAGNVYLDKSRLGHTDQPTESTLNIRVAAAPIVTDPTALAALVGTIPIETDFDPVE